MNTPDDNLREMERQARAEQAERAHAGTNPDPQVAQYQLVMRALGRAPAHALPDDFAQSVLARIARAEEKAGFDDVLVSGLLLVLAVAGLAFVYPWLTALVDHLHALLPSLGSLTSPLVGPLQAGLRGLPWSLLAGVAVAIGAVMSLDALWFRKSQPGL